MLSYFIVFFIFLSQEIFLIFSMYTQTFDKGYTEISDELKDEIEALYETTLNKVDYPEIININTDTISADQEHSVNLKLPYKSGDLGTDIMELLYIKKEGELFSFKNYNITYFLNEENVIHTIYPNMFPDDIEDTVENDIDCNYTILNNTYTLKIQSFQKMKKIIFYSYVILGLESSSNTIKRIGYRDSSLYESDINNRVFQGYEYFNNSQNTIFLDIYKIEQLFYEKGYIVFLVKHKNNINKWDYLLLFYEIFLINEGFSLDIEKIINIKDVYHYDLNNSNLDELIKVKRIGIFKNYIFILFININKNNTFIAIDFSTNGIITIEEMLEKNENEYNFKNKNIIDFLIVNNAICLLIEEQGLILYTMRPDINKEKLKFDYNSFFEFKYGKKLDIYRNPFYGGIYIGVLFRKDKNKKGNEIYMELLLDGFNRIFSKDDTKSINVKINKIITASNKRNFKYMKFLDDFYSFFYDDVYKELFIYRIGLLNTIPYVTYKLRLTENITNSNIIKDINISNIVPIYNKDNGKFNNLLIGGPNYIVLNDLVLASHNLNCTFHAGGSFNLSFILKGEICANSIKKALEKTYVSCHKIIKYNFHVYGKDKEKFSFFIFLLFILIIFSSILFACFSINTNCFRNYKDIKPSSINKVLYSSQNINMLSSDFSSKDNLKKNINRQKEKIQ